MDRVNFCACTEMSDTKLSLTMGSLFDGIGGFPLAAVHNGIIPMWASEIEAFPIEVTKLRFPDMIHVGDITKLNGAELPPVDIICGGSPCQDLSVAGARAGLAGERSSLFMEQVRLVKEMRDEDIRRGRTALDIRPRYMVWENVPGAFSSAHPKEKTSGVSLRRSSELKSVVFQSLDLTPGAGNLLGESYWELISPWRGDALTLNTGVSPREEKESSLSLILQEDPPDRYYLTRKACLGILRRASERGKELPEKLKRALEIQAGLARPDGRPTELEAYHINQPDSKAPTAFAANQRDEVRDLHDVAGALGAQPGMKQQTFIAAGFSAGQGSKAGSIGYQEECAPTLKAAESGTNMVPSILCLNDQGGSVMDCSEDVTGTLRAQEHGHQPLVYENHGIDARYTGPHKVAPTMSARYGTGGNNVPLVEQEQVFCITGNAIDRQPQNGGNGIGYQTDVAYTLTATDHHAVFSRQRVDVFKGGEVVSTQSARQHKDATDLVMDVAGLDCRNARENGDLCGTLQKGTSGSSLNSIHPIRRGQLIRRLTPLECERLQGFPDGWTDIPGASDSARYKALGNSVAIPCVDYVLQGIALVLRASWNK